MSNLLDDLPVPDEMTALKARADLLGLNYHPSIGLEKLKEKLAAAMSDSPEKPEPVEEVYETEGAMRMRLRKQANEQIRIRVTCMNPAKKEWEGEMFTSGNSIIGTYTKFVPFNIDEGWHVPRIIYNQIVDRKCQIFYSEKDVRNNTIRKGKLIKEFAVEVLPNLTVEELHELAQRQAMSNSIDV